MCHFRYLICFYAMTFFTTDLLAITEADVRAADQKLGQLLSSIKIAEQELAALSSQPDSTQRRATISRLQETLRAEQASTSVRQKEIEEKRTATQDIGVKTNARQVEVAALQKRLADLEAELQKISQDRQTALEKKAATESALADEKTRHEQTKRQHADVITQLAQREASNTALAAQQQELQTKAQQQHAANQTQAKALDQEAAAIAALEAELAALERENSELDALLKREGELLDQQQRGHAAERTGLQQTNDTLAKALAEETQRSEAIERDIKALEEKEATAKQQHSVALAELQRRSGEFEQALAEETDREQQLQKVLAGEERAHVTLTDKHHKLKQEHEALSVAFRQIREQLPTLERKLEELRERHAQAQREQGLSAQERAALLQTQRELQGTLEALQRASSASGKSDNPLFLNALKDIIRTYQRIKVQRDQHAPGTPAYKAFDQYVNLYKSLLDLLQESMRAVGGKTAQSPDAAELLKRLQEGPTFETQMIPQESPAKSIRETPQSFKEMVEQFVARYRTPSEANDNRGAAAAAASSGTPPRVPKLDLRAVAAAPAGSPQMQQPPAQQSTRRSPPAATPRTHRAATKQKTAAHR